MAVPSNSALFKDIKGDFRHSQGLQTQQELLGRSVGVKFCKTLCPPGMGLDNPDLW